MRGDAARGTLYVAISQNGWLDFLRSYPISEKATLTLNDRNGLVIARTLNNERWVGKRSGAEFLEQIRNRDEGTSQIRGLEGQSFYTAFSRSRASGWVLGTGVPRDEIEASLRDSTVAMVAGVVATALAVALFAVWIGSRIIGAITGLSLAARQVATPGGPPPGDVLAIAEAETVRLALHQAAGLLAARDGERNAAYAREAEARAEAERSNAAKDEFLAMLGHELRNPLSAVKSASALLALPGARPAVHQRSREVIERQVGRLTDLVDDMLDVARLNSGKIVLERRSSTWPRWCATCSARSRTPAAAAPARRRRAGAGLRLRRRDPARADRFQPARQRLQVHARRRHVRIETATTADDAPPWLVADDGSGIAAELLPRVFDVFAQGERTLERAQGGLGLGLTVVRRLVSLHGGRQPPRVPGSAAAPPSASACRPRQRAARRRRDRAADARGGADADRGRRRQRRQPRADADAARHERACGERGRRRRGRRRRDPRPGARGGDRRHRPAGHRRLRGGAAGARRSRTPRPLLVAVTGYGTPEDRQQALSTGFDAFLVKPFDIEAFERLASERLHPT